MEHDDGAIIITETQWRQFVEQGFCSLGVLGAPELGKLSARVDDIMLGRVPAAELDYGRLLMQTEDSRGKLQGGRGHSQGSTLSYCKVQGLEHDPVLREYMRGPLFRAVAQRLHGESEAVAVYRAMLINKPPGGQERVGWHMDRWATLDRDPKASVYLALDAQTPENGCIHVSPQSHLLGIGNERSSGAAFLTAARVDEALAVNPCSCPIIAASWGSGASRSALPTQQWRQPIDASSACDLCVLNGSRYTLEWRRRIQRDRPNRASEARAGYRRNRALWEC